jgi:hypothetical protein
MRAVDKRVCLRSGAWAFSWFQNTSPDIRAPATAFCDDCGCQKPIWRPGGKDGKGGWRFKVHHRPK